MLYIRLALLTVLSPFYDVHLLYKCTNEYDPQSDAGIRWNDPDIAINWPVENPIVSERLRTSFVHQIKEWLSNTLLRLSEANGLL
jgi:hypothetical protein